MLQRGRALSSAEMPLWRCGLDGTDRASTGPRSFERGDRNLIRTFGSILSRLQRGRALSSAEMPPASCAAGVAHPASTGPRSFERGDHVCHQSRHVRGAGFNGAALFRARRSNGRKGRTGRTTRLQRGRALSSAEIREAILREIGIASFNGAALFRARRWLLAKAKRLTSWASTGPRSFERGDQAPTKASPPRLI